MRARDLRLVELLDFAPEDGRIGFRDHRMLLWSADAFGNLRRELFDALGIDSARGILRRFGFANGYRDAMSTRALFESASDTEWWLTCPALQGHQGKVAPSVKALELDRSAGHFHLEVEWRNSYEAAHSSSRTSASRWGTPRVAWSARRVAEWGPDGDRIASEYQARSIARELEERDDELRRTARRLERSERELRQLRGADSGDFVARSREMHRVLDLVANVAQVDTTVLVTGESGTGKERIARMLHDGSPRSRGELIAINCAALPEPLLESELFGHVRGAFTGATSDKKGLFAAARGGTLLLDEIGEMTLGLQAKLLRVLQECEVRPVGATASIPVDVRVVAATNRDLSAMVDENRFRQDLYYRLDVICIEIPPLRACRDDVLPPGLDAEGPRTSGRDCHRRRQHPRAHQSRRSPRRRADLPPLLHQGSVVVSDAVRGVALDRSARTTRTSCLSTSRRRFTDR